VTDDLMIVIFSKSEMSLLVDALELLEDVEHLRPWRQDEARRMLDTLEAEWPRPAA
jgi:hypothetical protein